jgi:H+-translocating NAD(P) transhydrogenase subunit beta
MKESLTTLTYLVAGVLFISSLGGLSAQASARRGNALGVLGMVLAVAVTAISHATNQALLATLLGAGGAIGAILAMRVEMTSLPELVAILHSFVGLAAVLVGLASYVAPPALTGIAITIHRQEVFVGVFVGALTFTGSVVAYAKLRGTIRTRPLLVPGRHLLNAGLLVSCIAIGYRCVTLSSPEPSLVPLLVHAGIAGLIGVHVVMAIGGADMPVVVSMLNSYSGWAAAAAGFMLSNDLLIITGALVGSSGAILSHIMCRAMNRSFVSVVLGGFGATEGTVSAAAQGGIQGTVSPTNAVEVAKMLLDAKSVIVVPGYGMAVAHAQYPVYELVSWLRQRGTTVRFAIHPVAGRLPGHMNVLLAEAKVSYDIVLEMEDINEDFPETDLALVIGANDIVNPSALDDPSSPIYGMPVLQVWKAKATVVMKRSMASGYAGVENPLFFKDNTLLLFGDANKNVDAMLTALRASGAMAAAE